MKFLLLAAAAFIAVPAIAQDQTMTPPSDQPAAPADTTMSPPADPATPAPNADPSAPMTPPADAPMAQSAPMATPAPAGEGAMDPAGGYQPTAPALQGTPAPGATIRFQAAQSPDQAYPAPAPMAKYPVCKKGQYDNCMQRGGK